MFAVLPWGIRTAEYTETDKGHMPGAPEGPNFKRIIIVNSTVAAIFTGLLWLAVQFGGLNLKMIADLTQGPI